MRHRGYFYPKMKKRIDKRLSPKVNKIGKPLIEPIEGRRQYKD